MLGISFENAISLRDQIGMGYGIGEWSFIRICTELVGSTASRQAGNQVGMPEEFMLDIRYSNAVAELVQGTTSVQMAPDELWS